MASENLDRVFADFVVQNAPKCTDYFMDYFMKNKERIGRILAQLMLDSLSGKGFPPGVEAMSFAPAAALASPAGGASVGGHAPAALGPAASELPQARRRFPKFPGSAKETNKKVLAALSEKGSSIHDIVEKTGFPIDYVRTRLNRMMRDNKWVSSKGATTKARYFRTPAGDKALASFSR